MAFLSILLRYEINATVIATKNNKILFYVMLDNMYDIVMSTNL